MIILGNLEQAKYIPDNYNPELVTKIKEKLKLLDDNYGPLRVFSREGGFVAIIENTEDFTTLHDSNFLDISTDIPELIEAIGDYEISTYIVGTEYAIVLVEDKNNKYRQEYLDRAA